VNATLMNSSLGAASKKKAGLKPGAYTTNGKNKKGHSIKEWPFAKIEKPFDSIRSDRIRPNPGLNQVVNRTCIPTIREKSGIHLRGMIRTP
jgi:hypothetical protein